MKKTLTVISPVYNEEAVIRDFHRELRAVLDGLGDRYDSGILFVADGCTDSTVRILKEISVLDPSVKVLSLSRNFGHQMALLAGMDYSSTDAVIMMDSDLQHPPALIPEMLDCFEQGYDIVYTIRRDSGETGFFKRLTSKLFYRLINYMSQIPINEGSADFRLISRRVADIFQGRIRERHLFLRGLLSWVGFRSIGISFQAGPRRGGKSKYSLAKMIRLAIQGIISFSKAPLEAAVLLGFIFALVGLVLTVFTFVMYFIDKTFPSGWATLAISISMFSGVQLIFLGIIGEYVGAIFDEVKGRPHYIVEEKINFGDK